LPPSVANQWPAWEITTPQYPTPSVFNLLSKGYRSDELVFACMDVRAGAIAEPPLKFYTGKKDDKKEIIGHPARARLERPNAEMGEMEFWQASSIYLDAAGFCVWEVELNNGGEPAALWPMNPAYCAFMRGPQQPIRAVRYSVPGMPYVDVPRERLVIFQNFDPLYPWVRSLSRTAVALKSIGVRLSVTDFLKLFFDHGTAVNGILTTTQSLTTQEAMRNRELWRVAHGGYQNWGEPAVLGAGLTYQNVQTSFKDMAFPEVDGRTEASICMAFRVSPLIVAAKVGLQASTYSNYSQAQEAFTQEVRQPMWRYFSSEITQQLLPFYGDSADTYAEFDTSQITALKEDEDALWKRVDEAVKQNVIYRDEARGKMGFAPIDGGDKVFLGVTVKGIDAPSITAKIMDPSLSAAELKALDAEAKLAAKPPALPAAPAQPGASAAPAEPGKPAPPASDQFAAMVKSYAALRKAALDNPGMPIGADFDDELIQCQTKSQTRAVLERHHPRKAEPAPDLAEIGERLTAAIERATEKLG